MAATPKSGTAPAKATKFKKKESADSAQAARERKRQAKRKGLKPGTRQAQEGGEGGGCHSSAPKDPRIGSRKPVALVVETPVEKKPVAAPKPVKSAEQLEQERLAKLRSKQERELVDIENNERLNALLDRLDEGQSISSADEEWLEQMLERHQALLAELGIEDEDDEAPSEPDELLSRFINDEFDPSEIDPEYQGGKKK